MQNFFGVEIDTASMTLEELEEARRKVREIFSNIEFQIRLRKLASHKHPTSSEDLAI